MEWNGKERRGEERRGKEANTQLLSSLSWLYGPVGLIVIPVPPQHMLTHMCPVASTSKEEARLLPGATLPVTPVSTRRNHASTP
jgi:hypothetical protein